MSGRSGGRSTRSCPAVASVTSWWCTCRATVCWTGAVGSTSPPPTPSRPSWGAQASHRLFGADPARALSAEQKLRLIADTDVPAVAAAARAYLAGPGPADAARRLDHEIPPASPPRPQPRRRPAAAPSGPRTLAATLTHGSRWLTMYAVVFSPDDQILAHCLPSLRSRHGCRGRPSQSDLGLTGDGGPI
jgi:hypothetical protein